jgi:hypothetical protein
VAVPESVPAQDVVSLRLEYCTKRGGGVPFPPFSERGGSGGGGGVCVGGRWLCGPFSRGGWDNGRAMKRGIGEVF